MFVNYFYLIQFVCCCERHEIIKVCVLPERGLSPGRRV